MVLGFGSGQRFKEVKEVTPGPGHYDANDPRYASNAEIKSSFMGGERFTPDAKEAPVETPRSDVTTPRDRKIRAHNPGDGRKFTWATQRIHDLSKELESVHKHLHVMEDERRGEREHLLSEAEHYLKEIESLKGMLQASESDKQLIGAKAREADAHIMQLQQAATAAADAHDAALADKQAALDAAHQQVAGLHEEAQHTAELLRVAEESKDIITAELEATLSKVAMLERDLAAEQQTLAQRTSALQCAHEQVASLQVEAAGVSDALAQRERQLTDAQQALATANERVGEQQTLLAARAQELEARSQEVAQLQQALDERDADVAALRSALEEERGNLQEVLASLQGVQGELERSMQQAATEQRALQGELAQVKGALEQLQATHQESIEQAEQQRMQLTSQVDTLTANATTLTSQLEETTAQCFSLKVELNNERAAKGKEQRAHDETKAFFSASLAAKEAQVAASLERDEALRHDLRRQLESVGGVGGNDLGTVELVKALSAATAACMTAMRAEAEGLGGRLREASAVAVELEAALRVRDAAAEEDARRMRELGDALRGVEGALVATRATLTGELEEAAVEKQRLTGELEEAQTVNTQLTAQLEEAAVEKQQLCGQLEEAQTVNTRLTAQLEEAAVEKQQLCGQLEEAQTVNTRLTAQLEEAAVEKQQLHGQLEEAQTVNTQLTAQLEEAAMEKQQLCGQLEGAQTVNTQLTAQLEEAAMEKQQLHGQLDDATTDKQQLTAALHNAQQNSATLTAQLEEAEASRTQLQHDLESLTQQVLHRDAALKEVSGEAAEARQESAALLAAVAALEQQLGASKAETTDAQEAAAMATAELQGARAEAAAHAAQLAAQRTRVGELEVHVSAAAEAAVADREAYKQLAGTHDALQQEAGALREAVQRHAEMLKQQEAATAAARKQAADAQSDLQQLHKRLANTPKGKDASARVAVLEQELRAALQEGERLRGLAQQAETAVLENRRLGEDNAVLATRVKQLQVDLQELTDAGALGHNNPKQKIQYHLRLKQELEELRNECTVLLRERLHLEQCIRYLSARANLPGGPLAAEVAEVQATIPASTLAKSAMFVTPMGRRSAALAGRGRVAHQEQQGTAYRPRAELQAAIAEAVMSADLNARALAAEVGAMGGEHAPEQDDHEQHANAAGPEGSNAVETSILRRIWDVCSPAARQARAARREEARRTSSRMGSTLVTPRGETPRFEGPAEAARRAREAAMLQRMSAPRGGGWLSARGP